MQVSDRNPAGPGDRLGIESELSPIRRRTQASMRERWAARTAVPPAVKVRSCFLSASTSSSTSWRPIVVLSSSDLVLDAARE